MSNSKPPSIHIFVFKLGMQVSQDAVFTSFWWNNSFTLTFITSPAFIDKVQSFKSLKSPARWNKSLWRWPVLLLQCVLFWRLGLSLGAGVSALWYFSSWVQLFLAQQFIPPGDWQSTREAGRPQHLQPAFQLSPRIMLMWGYTSRDLVTFPSRPCSPVKHQCCYTPFTCVFVKALCGNNHISNDLLHCVQPFWYELSLLHVDADSLVREKVRQTFPGIVLAWFYEAFMIFLTLLQHLLVFVYLKKGKAHAFWCESCWFLWGYYFIKVITGYLLDVG